MAISCWFDVGSSFNKLMQYIGVYELMLDKFLSSSVFVLDFESRFNVDNFTPTYIRA